MSAANKKSSNAAYIKTLAVHIETFITSVYADIHSLCVCQSSGAVSTRRDVPIL